MVCLSDFPLINTAAVFAVQRSTTAFQIEHATHSGGGARQRDGSTARLCLSQRSEVDDNGRIQPTQQHAITRITHTGTGITATNHTYRIHTQYTCANPTAKIKLPRFVHGSTHRARLPHTTNKQIESRQTK